MITDAPPAVRVIQFNSIHFVELIWWKLEFVSILGQFMFGWMRMWIVCGLGRLERRLLEGRHVMLYWNVGMRD